MMKILLAGYVALEATHKIIDNEKPALCCRFSNRFLLLTDEMTGREMLTRDSIERVFKETGFTVCDYDMSELSDMGIFGSLWKMAENNETGIHINLDKILIRQETIEICEWMNVNPYTYPSKGAFLIRSDKAYEMKDALISKGITASVIGYETENNDRVVENHGEIRFLTPIDRLLKDEQGYKNYR